MSTSPTLLGIESSCDDTAAAVTVGDVLQSSVVSSQLEHADFGGVVPEIASRAHQRLIVPVVRKALKEAEVTPSNLDAVAATYGPGLSGSLLVGLSFAKSLALGLGVPFVGVNHLEGHLYSAGIEPPRPPFPYLCLIVSGGHTQLVRVGERFQHTVLGRTLDDAAGEAFDKVAQLLGLGYPGGPAIDEKAREGDPSFHAFPRSHPGEFDFSFSGLKTSVLYYLKDHPQEKRKQLLRKHLPDICASFQQAVVGVLVDAVRRAVDETGIRHVAIAGGVAANSLLRAETEALSREQSFTLYVPRLDYCMDNAAMIAWAGLHKYRSGRTSDLSLSAEPRLALASL